MPNSFAYLMLLVWPLIAVVLFRRLPLERALVWSILGAYLILPPLTQFDFPLVPPLDKVSIPNLSAFLICALMLGHRIPLWPESTIGRGLVVIFLFSVFASVMTNGDPIPFATGGLPGLRIHDAISALMSQILTLLPFLLARSLLGAETGQREILLALMIAALGYSLPMLLEIRLSPQLNVWVYGFFQHSFIQMIRQGGFRPIVFLPHALWAAFFVLMALVSAATLWITAEPSRRLPLLFATCYLAVLLVLCKTMGVLIYAVLVLPLIRLFSLKTQIRVAALMGLLAVTYPLLRGGDLIPVQDVVAQVETQSVDRAQSLAFRFDNEDALLARASERPWLGWGPWGRGGIHDPISGKLISVVDGRWIITIGTYGWFGFIAEFGLLAFPLILLARRTWGMRPADISPYAGSLALMLGVNLVDMLVNATLIPFTWLLGGAMLGYGENLARKRLTTAAPPVVATTAPHPDTPRTIL